MTALTALRPARRYGSEHGVALLLAIFALLLISAAAIGLILTSGSESALASNYRSSAQAFYAGLAGLEESRGRLWPGNASFYGAFVATPGGLLMVGQVRYVLNPAKGETVQPTNMSASNPYADWEYQQEFGKPLASVTVQTTSSVTPVAGLQGPMFKWTRINPATEKALGYDLNGDGVLDNNIPLFYDGSKLNLTSTGLQALELTSLAVMPNGTRKLVQYIVAPVYYNLSFPAALTLDGTNDTFSAPSSNVFHMDGIDQASGGTCAIVQPPKPAIGVPDNNDVTSVIGSIMPNRLDHYVGLGPTPSVLNVSATLPPVFQNVTALDGPNGLMQTLQQNADYVVQGPVGSLPSYGSTNAPVTVFVNGDLSLSGNVTGYGILVVTGTYTASGTVGWKGIVLVVGQGNMNVNGGGNNQYDGAILIAKTRDSSGNLLANLGQVNLSWNGGGGNGVYYNSCLVNQVQQYVVYQVLSFREIQE